MENVIPQWLKSKLMGVMTNLTSHVGVIYDRKVQFEHPMVLHLQTLIRVKCIVYLEESYVVTGNFKFSVVRFLKVFFFLNDGIITNFIFLSKVR